MLKLENIQKKFEGALEGLPPALGGVSLDIKQGEFFTLLGPSGCGKTTALRSVAGLERPDSGRITVGDRVLFDGAARTFVPPQARQIGMVFQSYAIWPHMNVFENAAFPLRVAPGRLTEAEVEARVRRVLETVELAPLERRPASRLSGGQQQRLAIARALVMNPKVLLLDEPLSNLDAVLREAMRRELRHLQQSLGITTVYVTHDQAEALSLSDTIAVMQGGRVVQVGDPRSIYDQPANRFVAEFIGSTNVLHGRCSQVNGEAVHVEGSAYQIRCARKGGVQQGDKIAISVRPENIRISSSGHTHAANEIAGRVVEQQFLGSGADVVVAVGDERLRVWSSVEAVPAIGSEVFLSFDARHCMTLPAESH